jgi:hypothetical protein
MVGAVAVGENMSTQPNPSLAKIAKKTERHLRSCVIIGIMRRLGLLLVVLALSAAFLHAQRTGGGSRGGGARVPGGSGITTWPWNGFFPQHSGSGHRRGYGSAWLPGYFPYWDDDDYFQDESSYQQPVNTTLPQVIVVKIEEPRPPAPPPEPPKLIEVSQSKDAPIAQRLPPTLFVLTDGERLESRHYLLTAESLQIEVGRQQRTIPVSVLDLDASIALNYERGIEITVPRDNNQVLIGF